MERKRDFLVDAVEENMEGELDYVLVPLGMLVLGIYHVWLISTIRFNPKRTVIGLNAESRHQWVFCMMADPLKNGVLAVQTIRNNIMASTLLATAAITLCSLISVYTSSTNQATTTDLPELLLHIDLKTNVNSSVKYSVILVCFLVAFVCNLQSIRYYAHCSFLVTLPTAKDSRESKEYVVKNLNRGSYFWSLGMRSFYISLPMYLWVFGPIQMFACCCILTFLLYFLDTTSSFTRNLHKQSIYEEGKGADVGSVSQQPWVNQQHEDSSLQSPLLGSHLPVSVISTVAP